MASQILPVLAVVVALFGPAYPAATTLCKNCVARSKDERAMFRAHSDACLVESGATRSEAEGLLSGITVETPALKKHVYCVLRKCKIIGKDGKLQKAAVLGKLAGKANAKNATKILESCFAQADDTPEDLAWSLFRCGYEKKAVLFDLMPKSLPSSDAVEENISSTRR